MFCIIIYFQNSVWTIINNFHYNIMKKKYGDKFRPIEKSKEKKNLKKNESDSDLLFN